MKIKVSSSYTGVISTGSYENARPAFSAEIEIETADLIYDADVIHQHQRDLQSICYDNFKNCEQQAIVERINKQRKDFRWYGAYPSVTSVINWDVDFFIPPHELQQYASQGNLIDAQVKHFIKTKKWEDIEKIPDTMTDKIIVVQGNLNLETSGWNFPAFLEKYPLENMELGKEVISKKHEFGGTPDIRKCYFQGKKTLADVKRTPDKWKHFKQCAAYIMAEEENGESPYEQMMLIPLNTKTAQGFSKPIIETEIDQYKSAFLKDRADFKKRFGA